MEVISSIYNSGHNIKKFYLGSRELNLAYLGNQVIYDEVIGDNDLNYILYEFYGSDTLPNTVEAPVKRAILKGNTEGMSSVKMPVLKTLNDQSNLFFIQTPINFFSWSVISFDTFIKAEIYVKADDTVSNRLRLNVVQNIDGKNKENIYTNVNIKNGVNVEIENVQYIGFHDYPPNEIKGENNEKLLELIESGKLEIIISDKRNILTANEDVTLRSNGDVYDELNLLTGRLTQRIDENNEVLAQEVVKTVDLTIVDQDGKTINKLNSFNGTTHVSTEVAENSIYPTIAIEVATE